MAGAQLHFYYQDGQLKVHASQGLNLLLGFDDLRLQDGTIHFRDFMHPHDEDI